MNLNIFKLIITISFLVNVLNATCPDGCPGCNGWYELKMVPTAKEITEYLKKTEDEIAKKYKEEIIPIKKENKVLEKEIAKVKMRILLLQKKIDYNQKKILYQDEKINLKKQVEGANE